MQAPAWVQTCGEVEVLEIDSPQQERGDRFVDADGDREGVPA